MPSTILAQKRRRRGRLALNGLYNHMMRADTQRLLHRFAAAYGDLEKQVLAAMTRCCGPFCARCAAVCCRPVYCREALESPFLAWVRKAHAAHLPWSSTTGWLGDSGCRLAAGRPLVCYEFVCDGVLTGQPDARAVAVLKELAVLLTRVGRRARAGHHLLEVRDFERVNWDRLEIQLAAAQAAIGRLTGITK